MDKVAKLRKELEALQKGIDNPSTPANFKEKMRSTMTVIQGKIDAELKKEGTPEKKTRKSAPKKESSRGGRKDNPSFKKAQEIAKELKAKDPSLPHTKAISMAWASMKGESPKKETPKKEAPKKEERKSRAKDLKARVKKNTTSKDRDGVRFAKPVGKRISKDGNTYYEYRENRTDSNIGKRSYKRPNLFAKGGSVDKDNFIPVFMLSDDEKLNYHIAKEKISESDNKSNRDYFSKLLDKMLTFDFDGKKYYSLGYDTEGKGRVFSLEDALKNAKIIAQNLGHKYSVGVKETAGAFGEKDILAKKFVVMTSPMFSKEMLNEMQYILKFEKGGMMYEDGGRLSDMADYVTKYKVKSVEVEMDGKTVTLDGSQLMDGIYVKKNSFEYGGMMAKGGIYSSDDRWVVTFQDQDSGEFEKVIVRSNNKKSAIAIAEDESGLGSNWQYYSAEQEMADGGMTGGMYKIVDLDGDTVESNLTEQGVIEFADTLGYYEAQDNEEEPIYNLDSAISLIEMEGDYNVVKMAEYGGFMKRGGDTGNYNYGRSYFQDRARIAKGQDYEKYYHRKGK